MQKEKQELGISKQISSISAIVNNAYTVGSIIGYCIIDSLKDYTPSSKPLEKNKQAIEEMSRIRDSFESTKKRCQRENEHSIILSFQTQIKEYLYRLQKKEILPESDILKEFAKRLQSEEGNPEDYVSRRGLSFLINSRMKGCYVSSDQTLNDYESILNYFTR